MTPTEQVGLAVASPFIAVGAYVLLSRLVQHAQLLKAEWHVHCAMLSSDDPDVRRELEEVIRLTRALHKGIWK